MWWANNEHNLFRCQKFHELGHIYRDCPTNNLERNVNTTVDKNPKGFTKVGGKGKGGRWMQKKTNEERQLNHNRFEILEEEEGNKETNQEMKNIIIEKERDNNMEDIIDNAEMENIIIEKERDDNMEDIIDNNQQKEDLPSSMEINKDHEMTPSEARMEDHEL